MEEGNPVVTEPEGGEAVGEGLLGSKEVEDVLYNRDQKKIIPVQLNELLTWQTARESQY